MVIVNVHPISFSYHMVRYMQITGLFFKKWPVIACINKEQQCEKIETTILPTSSSINIRMYTYILACDVVAATVPWQHLPYNELV